VDTTNGQRGFNVRDNGGCPLFLAIMKNRPSHNTGETLYYWQVEWASRKNRMAALWFAFVGLSCTGSLLIRTKKTYELEQNT
jgi:hypothetical protein